MDCYSVHGRLAENGAWDQVAPLITIKKIKWKFLWWTRRRTLMHAEPINSKTQALNIANANISDKYQDVLIWAWDYVRYEDCTILEAWKVWENGRWVDRKHLGSQGDQGVCVNGDRCAVGLESRNGEVTLGNDGTHYRGHIFRLLNPDEEVVEKWVSFFS